MKCFTFAHLLLLPGVVVGWPQRAVAHLGPPYPIMNDQTIPGYVVSVTANPDVWRASAYVTLTAQSSSAQPVQGVDIWLQPRNRQVARVTYPMTRDSSTDPIQFSAQPDFTAPEIWYVGIDIKLGDGAAVHLITETLATPPGVGPWGLLLFLIPFLIFGSLWGAAIRRRRLRKRRAQPRAAAAVAKSARTFVVPQAAHRRDGP